MPIHYPIPPIIPLSPIKQKADTTPFSCAMPTHYVTVSSFVL